jgi:hypothetical protein
MEPGVAAKRSLPRTVPMQPLALLRRTEVSLNFESITSMPASVAWPLSKEFIASTWPFCLFSLSFTRPRTTTTLHLCSVMQRGMGSHGPRLFVGFLLLFALLLLQTLRPDETTARAVTFVPARIDPATGPTNSKRGVGSPDSLRTDSTVKQSLRKPGMLLPLVGNKTSDWLSECKVRMPCPQADQHTRQFCWEVARGGGAVLPHL